MSNSVVACDIYFSFQADQNYRIVENASNKLKTKFVVCTSHEFFERCKIIIFFLTKDYTKSQMCINELQKANELGKDVIFLLLEKINLNSIPISNQIFETDLAVNFFYDDEQQYDMLLDTVTDMLKGDNQFDFFCSYESKSRDIVLEIKTALESSGYTTWYDKDQLDARMGKQLINEPAKGVLYSEFFICFLSKLYTESDNCEHEYSYALEKKKPAIFIVLEKNVDIPPGLDFYKANSIWLGAYKEPNEESLKDRLLKSIPLLKRDSRIRRARRITKSLINKTEKLCEVKEIKKYI